MTLDPAPGVVILATGFYEWNRDKQKYFFTGKGIRLCLWLDVTGSMRTGTVLWF